MKGYATLLRQAASKADYAFFAHAGFTQAEQAEGERHWVTLVTLAQLDEALGAAAKVHESTSALAGGLKAILPWGHPTKGKSKGS